MTITLPERQKPEGWIIRTSATVVRQECLRLLRENPDPDHRGDKYHIDCIARILGAGYREKKAIAKINRALVQLAETPDVERTGRGMYRYVSFEERKQRADAAAERSRKKNLSETLVKYLKKEGYDAKTDRYGYSGRVTIDADSLYKILANHEPVGELQ